MMDKTSALTDLKHELRALLIPVKWGMSISELMDSYKKNNRNEDIPFAKFKFNSCLALLKSMPDVCHLKIYQGEMRAFAVANEDTIHIQRFVQNQKNDRKRGNYSFTRGTHRNYQQTRQQQPFQTRVGYSSNAYEPPTRQDTIVRQEPTLPVPTIEDLPFDCDFKCLTVSSSESFYIIRHPFSKKPCLTCIDLVKVFSLDSEDDLLTLDHLRGSGLDLSNARYRRLWDTIQSKCDTNQCRHMNSTTASVMIYELHSVCVQMRRSLGVACDNSPLLAIFTDQCSRAEKLDYWQHIFNYYKPEPIEQAQCQDSPEIPPIDNPNDEQQYQNHFSPQVPDSTPTLNHPSLSPYQNTVWRCATPFERCFSTNLLYQHEPCNHFNDNYMMEHDKCLDLYRITLNLINVFRLEQCEKEMQTNLFVDTLERMPLLLSMNNNEDRVFAYNTCLLFVCELTPTVKKMLDKIYSI